MRNLDPWEKYDRAIEHLRELDAGSGSYLEEIAGLIEELIARVIDAEEARRPKPPKTPWEVENDRRMSLVGKQLAKRSRNRVDLPYSSPAKDDAE